MKNKKHTIIGITSLILVMLLLIGLTYAYYRTRIIGNESTDPSISVLSKKLEIVYSDDNPTLNMEGLISPGFEYSKTFYVENTGNETVNYVVYLEDVVNEYTRSQDWTYSITCIDSNNSECTGVSTKEYPTLSEQIIETSIASGVTQNYTLTISYANSNENQSDDMGKKLEGKIQIYSPEYVVDLEGTVANALDGDYVQINSVEKKSQIVDGKYRLSAVEVGSHTLSVRAKNGTVKGSTTITIEKGTAGVNGSTITINDNSKTAILNITNVTDNLDIDLKGELSEWEKAEEGTLLYALKTNQPQGTDETIPAQSNSLETEARILEAEDDYGISYVYRGNVQNNYLNFAGMCWRVVRVEGDGSVKLILEDMYAECNDNETAITTAKYTGNWSDGKHYAFGTADNYRADFINYSGGLADSFQTFQTSLAKKINISLGDSPTDEAINSALSSKLKVDEWCYDHNITEIDESGSENYGAYTRIYTNKKPSLKCTGTKLTKFKDNSNMYVGTLTADEMSFAGAYTPKNYNYYLTNKYGKDNYLFWWSLSPSHFSDIDDFAFCLDTSGGIGSIFAYDGQNYMSSRPAVSLKSGSVITGGEGIRTNPYIIG